MRKEKAPISDVAINRKDLSERDICSKFIGPAVKRAGWDGMIGAGRIGTSPEPANPQKMMSYTTSAYFGSPSGC